MHNGDDTAYYLHRGFRVIAIEADPTLVEAAGQRFADALTEGRLIIVETAVGSTDGMVPFWISTNREYNSFSRANASKWGHSCHAIEVPCRPFRSLLAEHGVPYYLKVDIEGADRHCVDAIDPVDPPRYLSFEKQRLEDLFLARDRGYSRFKLIAQDDFRQLVFPPPRAARFDRLSSRIRRGMQRVMRRGKSLAPGPATTPSPSASTLDGWRFPYASSGPFGEDTDGQWRTLEDVAFSWLAYDLGHTGAKDPAWQDWFDVHCAL